MNLGLARKSEWSFTTSNGGGVSAGIVGAEGGSVTLNNPTTNQNVRFAYGALGAGLGLGIKLPKLGRVHLPFVSAGSSESFDSRGRVFMAREFVGQELTVRDFCGGCYFIEVSGGLVWGGAGYAMMFGMNPALLAAAALPNNPFFSVDRAIATAKGYIVFAGVNFGVQASIGVTGFLGLMYSLG